MRILLNDLQPNQGYGVRFRLVGNGQQSDWSSITRFTTSSDVLAPANVTGLTVKTIGTAFEVTWNEVTTNTDGTPLKDFKDYQVSITAAGVTRYWNVTQERFDFPIEVNTNAFGTPQGQISVSVSARDNTLNIANNAPSASAQNAAPPAPTGFAGKPTVNGINFTWNKAAIEDLKYYRVYEATNAVVIDNLVYEGPANNFTWSSIDFTTNHYFKVATVDVFNQEAIAAASVSGSALAYDGTDKAPPANPTWPVSWFASETDLSNKYNAVANVTLTWNANVETDLGSYIVRYKKNADAVWAQTRVHGTALTAPATSVKISGLSINTAYNFQLAAVDKSGNISDFVAAPADGTTTRDTTAPSAPSTPVVTNYKGGILQVAWDGKNSTGGTMEADIAHIQVHVSTATGFTPSVTTLTSVFPASAGANKTLLADLTYGTTYYVKLIAQDFASNNSPASAQSSGVPAKLTNTDVNIPEIGTAQQTATDAMTTANGKNAMVFSINDASGTVHPITALAFKNGDIWFKKDGAGVIIKQWEFNAGTWTVRTIDNAVIANLDAGKINAGTINAARIGAKTITAEKLAIGSFDNLIQNSGFEDSATAILPHVANAGVTAAIGTTTPKSGLRTLELSTAATTATELLYLNGPLNDRNYHVKPSVGDKYLIEGWFRAKTATVVKPVTLGVKAYTAAGTLLGTYLHPTPITPTNAASVKLSATLDITWATVDYIVPFIAVSASTATGVILVDDIYMRRMVGTTLIEPGSITTQHITVDSINGDRITAQTLSASKIKTGELAATARIIAGPELGTHAEMSGTGFRVFAEDPVDGIPNEVVRLGTDTNDYFAVTKADGSYAATIDDTGRASLSELTVSSDPVFQGRTLTTILEDLPRGQLVYGELQGGTINNITTNYGLFEVSYQFKPNRALFIEGSIWFYPTGSPQEVYVDIHWTTNGSSPTINSPILREFPLGMTEGAVFDYATFRTQVWSGEFGATVPGQNVRLLVSVKRGNGGGTLSVQSGNRTHITISDVGIARSNSGVNNTGGGTTAVPKQTFYEVIPASWSQCYKGDNAIMSNAAGRLYQGQDPSGYNGNQRSLIGFPDLIGKLSGAVVNKIDLYLYASHWYNNSGGTAVIGTHGHTGAPGSWSGSPNRMQQGSWPKPGGRAFDITGWAGEFQSGSTRGISLGYAPDTNLIYYGYFNGAGQSYFPELRITYTK